jgi:integrase
MGAVQMTVDDLMVEWLEDDVKGSVKESTYLSYKESFQYHVSPELGLKEVRELLPKNIKPWYTRLRERTSDYTSRNALACLRGALNWAVANHYISVNPTLGMRLGTPKRKRMVIKLKLDDLRALRVAATDYHLMPLIIDAAIFTGNRLGEILAWQFSHINWDEGTIQISEQLQVLKNKKGRSINKPKTESSIALSPLAPRLLTRLRLLWEERLHT